MNNINARLTYQTATASMADAFNMQINQVKKAFKMTQSFLRLEQALVAGQTQYQFPVLINQSTNGVVFNTEQRLNLQDSFVISEILFYIAFPTSAVDATFKPLTYVSPTFTINDAAYQSLYNGQLSFRVNNNVLLPAWDLDRHYYAPETQQTAALGAGSPMDERRGAVDGFYPMEPNLTLVGARNLQVFVSLPAGLAAIEAFSRIGLIFRGILAQNSTVVS